VTTATDLVEQALATIRRHRLLGGGEVVLVAVSGGADSLALLDVLATLRPKLDLTVHALHVHHGLRPEADGDAEFVRASCARLDVPFHVERIALRCSPEVAGEPWAGLEAEARQARYAVFRERARALGAARVATGHTADDQAETVLMRLLAGAGPRGLAGIAPLRGPYIRPLLESRRAAVEAHLRRRGLGWVEDSTNRDPRFLRNRVRHDLLPFLAGALDRGIVESLCRGAAAARSVVNELETRAGAELARLARSDERGLVVSLTALRDLPVELAAEVLRQAALRRGSPVSIRAPGQRALRAVLAEATNWRPFRLGRARVERSGRWLRVADGPLPALAERRFTVPGTLALDEVGLHLEARCFPRSPSYAPPRDRAIAAFDADRLPPVLTVRARRAGDRFPPFGATGERRLKSFLIDAGVPRWERPRTPLLEADGEIVWVVGLRRGRAALVTCDTRRILEVTVRSPLAVLGTAE
jgi:tRNA(Ile)-lysidine synthase